MTDLSPAMIAAASSATTFVFGIAVGRFSMTKKERKDFEQKNYENTRELITQTDAAYETYGDALMAYKDAPTPASTHFFAISRSGDLYFEKLNLMCAAILSGKVDREARNLFLLAKVRNAVTSLEDHYATLAGLAQKLAIDWPGELRRENYEAIYVVVERHGPTDALSDL